MSRWWVALVFVAACGFPRLQEIVVVDGAPMQDARACYGTSVQICFPAAPLAVKNLATVDINTDTDVTNCEGTNEQKSQYCVVVGNGLTLPAGQKITAHGSKPLVLLSVAAIDLSGDIDVSSLHDGTLGAGANPAAVGACSPGAHAALLGGAAGGSFSTKGGDGSDQGTGVAGAKGTAGAAVGFPGTLRGGCPGGNGMYSGLGDEGRGGNGGGAIAVVAIGAIHIDGKINASGSAGHGAPGDTTGGGGGGGGSGGMILFQSPMALALGTHVKLWANGGGGAQGGQAAAAGSDGAESPSPTFPGVGSSGSGAGGNGGDGSTAANMGGAGQPAGAGGGGGGGGGGAGYILAPGVMGAMSISPPSYVP